MFRSTNSSSVFARLQAPMHPQPQPRPGSPRSRALLAGFAAALLASGCTLPIQTARMALQPGLESAVPLPFEDLGGGRSGRFTLDGERVSFRRMGDALSVLERLQLDRVSVEFTRASAQGRCDGRRAAVAAGIVDTPLKPLELHCRFTGLLAGELVLREPRLASAGTSQTREGQARFGRLTINIRSEHVLAGSPLPLAAPAGYRLLLEGRDVAALELTEGTPVLRLVAGLGGDTRVAILQAALALGLLFDPAATLS